VAYFAQALVLERWPLREPVTLDVFNPDDRDKPLRKTFHHVEIDDLTRQHAAKVLMAVGAPAVPTLVSPAVLGSSSPSVRTYALYALGTIGTDEAVEALARVLAGSESWRDRAAAAKGLGFALARNPAARPPLERALGDPDGFVQTKVREALAGRSRLEF
jgi:HEAT repeat protein